MKIQRMQSSKIKDVTTFLESIAPQGYQESYDNSGLLTGDSDLPVKGILVTLDCTEAVVDEAIQTGCNMIVAHHPIIFKGLKKLTGRNYVERTVIKAVKNDIAIYACHTNLDNVLNGVNKKISEKLELRNISILQPKKSTLSKLVTFIPEDHAEIVLKSLYHAGAGQIGNYKDCSFQMEGTGTFTPGAGAFPHTGEVGKAEKIKEIRVEVVLESIRSKEVISALRSSHPYEEVAFYLSELNNLNQEVGSGMIGELKEPEEPLVFLERLKKKMNAQVIRYTQPAGLVRKVAVCGGAGSFLLQDAIAKGADAFVSSDFKYHEFFDADGKIMIADIGHFESEQFTKELFSEVLSKRFPNFAIIFSKAVTNPISYL